MSILIGSLEFQGPVRDFELLSDAPAVYGILSQSGDEYELIHFAETDSLRHAIFNLSEMETWERAGLEISVCVHYAAALTPAERAQLKLTLENEFEIIDAAA